MKAMLLRGTAPLEKDPRPLSLVEMPAPGLQADEVLIRVSACGVCHTELDEIEGRMSPRLPVILGHQAVGVVEAGPGAGRRVGVAWIASACGECPQCRAGNENLCAAFQATGRDVHGGYAAYMTARADFVHPIPESIPDVDAAPLLCAGAIGYRSLRLSGIRDGASLGLTGFGGSNHLVLKIVRHKYPNTKVFVFSRNPREREFALALGAVWAGEIGGSPPQTLDAVIDTTPAWKPVVEALKQLAPGGRIVVNAIRKEEADKAYLQALDFASHLWMEREIKSVANVTRQDVREFLSLAASAGIKPEYQVYPLEDANQALLELKQGKIRGSKVLMIGP
jgi:propanol-preferring alcohol dehydrogenase